MSVEAIKSVLTEKLDLDLRRLVHRRVEAMEREARYLDETADSYLRVVMNSGWTLERLSVLCVLNSFYQFVLGPLASSSHSGNQAMDSGVVIRHGSIRFDANRSRNLRAAYKAFVSSIDGVPDARSLLTAPHFRDLVFKLARAIEENM